MNYDNKENLIKLGKNIKMLRNLAGKFQEELSSDLEMDTSQLSRIESGKNACSVNVVIDICKKLNISSNTLFSDILDDYEEVDIEILIQKLLTSNKCNEEMRLFLKYILNYFK